MKPSDKAVGPTQWNDWNPSFDIFRKFGVIARGEGHGPFMAQNFRHLAQRAFRRDVDGIRPKGNHPAFHIIIRKGGQANIGISWQRESEISVRRGNDFNGMTPRAKVSNGLVQCAHHAVDLWVPSVCDE